MRDRTITRDHDTRTAIQQLDWVLPRTGHTRGFLSSRTPSNPACLTDINWHTNRIHVQRTLQRADKLLGHEPTPFTTPKTAKSIRTVPLRSTLRAYLEIHRRDHWQPNAYDLTFANEAGEPIDAHNLLTRVYYPATRRAGLHQIRFHDLRHTFVTHCAAAGVPQEQVRDWIGHTHTRMTELYRAASIGAESYALDALNRYEAGSARGVREYPCHDLI